MKKLIVLTVALAAVAAQARHVRETMTLAKGWNAVYLESTPDDATCADFFAGSPVVSVGNYVSDATDATAQYRSDGSEVNQKPVQFKSWFAGSERASTLRTLFGGNVYVIYASNSWSKAFLGVPSVPDFDWHKADKGGNGSLNLVGVSAPAGAVTSPADYFGPGPFGSDGAVYQIGGLNESAPAFLLLTLGRTPRIYGGQAYALTADVAENWPGVIRIGGVSVAGLDFGASARTAAR